MNPLWSRVVVPRQMLSMLRYSQSATQNVNMPKARDRLLLLAIVLTASGIGTASFTTSHLVDSGKGVKK